MYLIKNIYLDKNTNCVVVENGIRTAKIKSGSSTRLEVFNSFWGKTEINLGEFADFLKMEELEENQFLLSYTNEYEIENLPDGFKKIEFNVSMYEPKKVEGYIIFVENEQKIQTNGKVLFGRYPSKVVTILREGEFIKISGKEILVINNKSVLSL